MDLRPTLAVLCLLLGWNAAQWVGAVESPQIIGRPMLLNASTDETKGTILDPATMARCREGVIYLSWATDVTSGAVQFESIHADSTSAAAAYTGVWAPQGDPVIFDGTAPNQDSINATGVYEYVRLRVETAVAGGAAPGVSAWLTCN